MTKAGLAYVRMTYGNAAQGASPQLVHSPCLLRKVALHRRKRSRIFQIERCSARIFLRIGSGRFLISSD